MYNILICWSARMLLLLPVSLFCTQYIARGEMKKGQAVVRNYISYY